MRDCWSDLVDYEGSILYYQWIRRTEHKPKNPKHDLEFQRVRHRLRYMFRGYVQDVNSWLHANDETGESQPSPEYLAERVNCHLRHDPEEYQISRTEDYQKTKSAGPRTIRRLYQKISKIKDIKNYQKLLSEDQISRTEDYQNTKSAGPRTIRRLYQKTPQVLLPGHGLEYFKVVHRKMPEWKRRTVYCGALSPSQINKWVKHGTKKAPDEILNRIKAIARECRVLYCSECHEELDARQWETENAFQVCEYDPALAPLRSFIPKKPPDPCLREWIP